MVTPVAGGSFRPSDLSWRQDVTSPVVHAKAAPAVSAALHPSERALNVCAFVLPAVSFVEVALVGRLLVIEVLLVALLPWLVRVKDRLRVPRWFLFIWSAWFLSQVLTDIVVGSAFADYARGWAKIIFTLTNFVAIGALVATPARARLFALGLAIAGVATYFVSPDLFPADDPWKWAFATPIGLVLMAALSGTRGGRTRWLPVLALAIFGALNLLLGYRSLGGVSLVAAGYFMLNGLVGSALWTVRPSLPRALVGTVFGLILSWGVFSIYDVAAAGGFLGKEVQSKYYWQSGSLGVLLGGRSEALGSTQAIIDSPLLGHGSWARDFKYVDLLADRLSSLGYGERSLPQIYDDGLIPTHSYVLGAWVEAGLLGSLFWVGVGLLAVWVLLNLYAVRLALAPLIVFSSILLLWSIAFSPYANSARLTAPFAIALCLLGLRLIQRRGKPSDSELGGETMG